MSITPKNWAAFQHYKDRSPAWIKLHRGLLDDFAFSRLPVASRALAPLLWLLASEYEGGKITGAVDEIAFRLHMRDGDLIEALKPLVDSGFFVADSIALAPCTQEAIPEREIEKQEETEKKDPSLRSGVLKDDWPKDYREQFWEAYPRKKSKKGAFRALDRIRKSGEVTFARLLAGIRKIPIGEPVFIPYPASWLNDGGYDDEQLPGENNERAGQNRANSTARPRTVAQDTLIAGMAEALAERPDSRLGNGGARGWGEGEPDHPNDNKKLGAVPVSLPFD